MLLPVTPLPQQFGCGQLNRFPTTSKLLSSSEDDSNTIGFTLVSSSENDSNAIEFTLVLDLELYGLLCWGVTFLVVFITRVIGSLVSGAGSDGMSFPCDL